MHNQGSAGFQRGTDALEKGGGVQFSETEIRGVRKISDHEVEVLTVSREPSKGIGVDHGNRRRVQRIPVEPGQQRLRFEESSDVAVEVYQCDFLHVGIPEDFTDCQSITAPEHQH